MRKIRNVSHFFDIPTVYQNGLKWYESTYFKGVRNERCIGDFTASYFNHNLTVDDKFITDKILWKIDKSYGTQATLEDFFV